jgi:hypothetical protein
VAGILVLTDAVITLGSAAFSISGKANKVEIPLQVDEQDATVFGGVWKQRTGGLLDAKLNATVLNSYGAGDVDELMWGWNIGRIPIPFAVKPTSAAIAPTNPQWSGLVLPTGYSPIAGDIGNIVKFDISWPTSGAVARAVS